MNLIKMTDLFTFMSFCRKKNEYGMIKTCVNLAEILLLTNSLSCLFHTLNKFGKYLSSLNWLLGNMFTFGFRMKPLEKIYVSQK